MNTCCFQHQVVTGSLKRPQPLGCGDRRETAVTSTPLLDMHPSLPCVGQRRAATFGVDPLEPWFSHLSHGSHNIPERAVLGLNDMVPRTYLMNGSDPKHGGNHYTVPVLSVNYCVEFDPYNNPML